MTPLEQAVEHMEAEYAAASPKADLWRAVLDALDDGQACRERYEMVTEAIEYGRAINQPGYEVIDQAIQAGADWACVVVRLENAGIIENGASADQVLAALSLFLPD